MKIAPLRRGEQQMAEFKKHIAKLKKHYGAPTMPTEIRAADEKQP
jgi:hypothetical protein